jgi:hypothetical protein
MQQEPLRSIASLLTSIFVFSRRIQRKATNFRTKTHKKTQQIARKTNAHSQTIWRAQDPLLYSVPPRNFHNLSDARRAFFLGSFGGFGNFGKKICHKLWASFLGHFQGYSTQNKTSITFEI